MGGPASAGPPLVYDSGFVALLLAALLIFCLRIADVTLGTLRIVMIVRGHRGWAGLLAFFESAIWVLAAAQVLGNLDEPIKIVGYAGGYAAGTVLGTTVERWLAIGTVLVRVVSPVDAPQAYPVLADLGYAVTVVNGEGRFGEVRIVFTVVPRKHSRKVLDLVADVNPDAFVTVEEANLPDLAARRRGLTLRK